MSMNNDEQTLLVDRVVAMDVRRKLRAEYQAAIDTFKAELDRIDLLNDTYAKIDYKDMEVHVSRVGAPYTNPRRYRQIKLDEIVIEFTGAED